MKSVFLITCLFFLSLEIYAQKTIADDGDKDTQTNFTVARKDTWLNRFEKRQIQTIKLLNLTEPQKRNLDVLNDNYVTQRVTLQEDKTLNLRSRQAKIEALRRDRETKFKTILTSAQLAKWNDLRKKEKKKTFRKK